MEKSFQKDKQHINPITRLLIFIPAKNEAKTIATVIHESVVVINNTYNITPDSLVIDDGSSDDTSKISRQAGANVIIHKNSVGLGSVFKEAVEYAVEYDYDYLLTIDGDGQFSTNEIPLLLSPIFSGEVLFTSGNRFKHGNDIAHMSKIKKFGNKMVASMVNYILNSNYTDVSCGFRAYDKEALYHLNLLGGFTYTQEVFLNLGFKGITIKEVPISVTYFPERKSRIARSIFRYGIQVSKIFLSSLIYYKPMKFFGTLAMLLWVVSLPLITILSIRYLETGLISPYKALGIISIVAFTVGIILLSIGVILYSLSRQQVSLDKLLYYAKKYRSRSSY